MARKCSKCSISSRGLVLCVIGALVIVVAALVGIHLLADKQKKEEPRADPHADHTTTAVYPLVAPNLPYNNGGYIGIGGMIGNAFGGFRGFGFGRGRGSVLSNPLVPPLSDSRYLVGGRGYGTGLDLRPIAASSDAVIADYRQVGMLTPQNAEKKDNLLPLMGRPLFARRGLWNYYAISNQNNAIKLPVTVKGKSAVNEYGVDELFNGDTVYVEGYDDVFRVTMYTNSSIQYVPF